MAKLKYKTQAVNTAIDPAGGYICRVINADPVEDDAVFQEVIDSLRLTESVFGLKKAMEAVIETAMRKTATDGVPRKVGGLFRTYITIRGKVPNGDSPFVALSGRGSGAYVRWGLSSEVQREVDYNSVSISNIRGGQSVSVNSIAYNGAEENAFDVRRGVPILVTGRNLAYIAGDLVEVSRTVDGADVVLATLTPEESDYYHESFAWPTELDDVPAGSELKFTFRLRGGDETASPVAVTKTVRVSEGATPPVPVNPPRITSGHSESHADDGKCYADGSGFVLEGDNLEDAIVTIAGSANEGETWSYEETVPADKVNFDADMLTIDGDWLDSWYNHLDVGELVKFTVTNSDGEDSNTFTLAS